MVCYGLLWSHLPIMWNSPSNSLARMAERRPRTVLPSQKHTTTLRHRKLLLAQIATGNMTFKHRTKQNPSILDSSGFLVAKASQELGGRVSTCGYKSHAFLDFSPLAKVSMCINPTIFYSICLYS